MPIVSGLGRGVDARHGVEADRAGPDVHRGGDVAVVEAVDARDVEGLLSLAAALLFAGGATYGGSWVFAYSFNVETAGDHPVWHRSEADVLPDGRIVHVPTVTVHPIDSQAAPASIGQPTATTEGPPIDT